MPYIYVDELPEGVEEAQVVTQTDYDSVVMERDSAIEQRDNALSQIEESNKEVRDIKAKYAEYILSSTNRETEKPQEEVKRSNMPVNVEQLFRG